MRIFVLFFLAVFLSSCTKQEKKLPTYTITENVLNEVDDRIFGGFFEKATWHGEIGSDAAISLKTREVIPEVKKYMDWMNIPILRFPGGTAIDYYPWYYLIDSIPGHHNTRPPNLHYKDLSDKNTITSDGRMGLKEYIKLCKELNIEAHLVTNLGDAFYKKRTIEDAAEMLGKNLVLYCNATEGEWAELRAANGSHEPFDVKYFQIGNETWLFNGFKKHERTSEQIKHYADCVEAYVRAMKKADLNIEIIIDGEQGLGSEVMKRCGELVSFQTFHSYSPWGINRIVRNNKEIAADSVSAAEVWQGLASAPFIDPLTGLSEIRNWVPDNVSTPLTMTEWNLNCWFQGDARPAKPENEFLAYGMGAASYLHALIRISDRVKIANQSMLVGTGWGITGIRVDTTETVRPQMYPAGMVTGLYSRNHGNQLLDFIARNVPYYSQPLTLSGIRPAEKVAELDVVVTADNTNYFVHVLNRSYDNNHKMNLIFPEKVKSEFTQITLSENNKGKMSEFAGIEEKKFSGAKKTTTVSVAAKSVSVFKFEIQ